MFVPSSSHPDLPLLLRCSCQVRSTPSVLTSAQLGVLSPTRNIARLGLPVLLSGLNGSSATSAIPDPFHLGLSLSVRSRTCVGPATTASRMACFVSTTPLLNITHSGSALSSHGFSRLGFSSAVPNLLHLDVSPSLQVFTCSDAASSIFRLSRAESLPLALNYTHSSATVLLRSSCQSEIISSLFRQSHFGISAAPLDVTRFSLSVLLRSPTCTSPALFLSGMTWPDSFPLVLDAAILRLSVVLRGMSCPRFLISVPSSAHPDMPLLLHGSSCMGSPLFVLRSARSGSVFPLFVVDLQHPRIFLLPHSFVRLSASLPVPDVAHPESPPAPRSSGRLGLTSLLAGIT